MAQTSRDQIHHGEPIAEVETDKADMVMEAFDDGLLDEIRVKEGESAKVGAVIAVQRSTGEVPRPQTGRPSGPPPELLPLSEAEAGLKETVPRFHPAMSAVQSATPTAIAAPPRKPALI